jgi:hypothetical protein
MKVRALIAAVALLAVTSGIASAAQFEFNTLVRYGSNSGGGGNWEFGIGNNTGLAGITSTQETSWSSGQSRRFELTYNQTANNVALRLYSNNGSSSVAASYTPSGGPALAGTLWTLPAAAFFATVPGSQASINISSLSLTNLTGAAISILSGGQPTAMFAQSGGAIVTQGQDIVFRGDTANGGWMLQGYATLNWNGNSGSSASNLNRIQFGVSAVAGEVPEPSTWAMMVTGLSLALVQRRRRR